MAAAEIFLSAFIQVLFDKLVSGELLQLARREKIWDQLRKWSRMLEQIKAVLADAEEKQMMKSETEGGIKLWLEDLEDLAYDLDDLLDEFTTDALRRQLTAHGDRPSTSKVRSLIPACCTTFNPRSLISDYGIRSSMDDINARLKDILERQKGLGLREVNIGAGTSNTGRERPPTTSLVGETCVFGRDKDVNEIIKLLQENDVSSGSKVGVVPIVGMGGVGKTTIAQMVYNDKRLENHFGEKAWVCVSDKFDIMGVTKAILESVTSQACGFTALDKLQVELKKALAGKKFLIVLDDVWNNNHGDWSILKSPFAEGMQGSGVVVTTRQTDVARVMQTDHKYHYHLKELSKDDCWSVFAQYALEDRSIDERQNLEPIGWKIVEKCGGLPLAARTLGGLLRCKTREDEWENVLNSKIWELPHKQSDILPALRLSYHHLPPLLKKCFAYCSILPKDYEFEENDLVLLWMAEGFIQDLGGRKRMEDQGGEYFRELLSRSLFQPSSSSGERSLFVMHDLINDLAQFVARKNCFRLEDELKNNGQCTNVYKARHSSYMRSYTDGIKKFKPFYEAKHLRTFLPLGGKKHCYLTSTVPLALLPSLRRLRVLSLSGYYHACELRSLIGNLKHVRYLDLSHANFRILPESMGNLYNLQTLMLRYCRRMKKLSARMGSLVNLRHLDVTGSTSLEGMPPNFGKLTNLQTLSDFIVKKGNGMVIREVGNLIHLSGTLCISGLENVVDHLDAGMVRLNDKESLDVLSMKWSHKSNDSRDGRIELAVLGMLQPHKKLKELTVGGYHGPEFPNWVGNPEFSKMVRLRLNNCKKCTCLPPLGQLPSLEELEISGMKAIKKVGLEFCGRGCSNPFPSLKTLSFAAMPEWEDWSHFGVNNKEAFRQLSKLTIVDCPKLTGKLPTNLPNLEKLYIQECPQLVVEWSSQSPTMLHQMGDMLHFNSLTSLSLGGVSILDSFRPNQELAGDEVETDVPVCNNLSSLSSMSLLGIQKMEWLPILLLYGLTGLRNLSIGGCEELKALWKNDQVIKARQHCFPAPAHLSIRNCPLLISLFEEEERDQQQQRQDKRLPCLMSRLESLFISGCSQLEKLPRGLHTLTFLSELRIHGSESLVSLPGTGLPPSLTTLVISYCKALRSLLLPEWNMDSSNLESLSVSQCESLTHLSSRGGLPPRLKLLKIYRCDKLESLLAEEGAKINCASSLEVVDISYCKNLKRLPDATRQNNDHLPNLTELSISSCEILECLPEGWSLTPMLKKLTIRNCKRLKALPYWADNNFSFLEDLTVDDDYCAAGGGGGGIASFFLKEGSGSPLLTNLTSLDISGSMTDNPPSELAFHRLSSLRSITLFGLRWVSFPEERGGMSLPNSLIVLRIRNFPNLEKLPSNGFQDLTSLETIQIWQCPRLQSLPKKGLPPSLEYLWLTECPNLASLPEQGLPPSLLQLYIVKCPILRKRCEKGKDKYWHSIAQIPVATIDGRHISQLVNGQELVHACFKSSETSESSGTD